jgi:hypothetical protein
MKSGGSFDARAMAKRINRRRQEYNRAHPDHPVRITPAMSRILELDEEYVPYRGRRSARRPRASAVNPTIATLVTIARALGTTVGDLLGEPAYQLSLTDRRRLRELLRYLEDRFDLNAPELGNLR